MNIGKGLGFLIVGILALLGGAAFAALLIKNKFSRKEEIDFDDFDTVVDDEEFDHFFGEDEGEEEYEYADEAEEADGGSEDKEDRL